MSDGELWWTSTNLLQLGPNPMEHILQSLWWKKRTRKQHHLACHHMLCRKIWLNQSIFISLTVSGNKIRLTREKRFRENFLRRCARKHCETLFVLFVWFPPSSTLLSSSLIISWLNHTWALPLKLSTPWNQVLISHMFSWMDWYVVCFVYYLLSFTHFTSTHPARPQCNFNNQENNLDNTQFTSIPIYTQLITHQHSGPQH